MLTEKERQALRARNENLFFWLVKNDACVAARALLGNGYPIRSQLNFDLLTEAREIIDAAWLEEW